MALMILPFRIGEFARPYLIAERPRIRVSATLSSVVVERVADGLFTALLLVITLLAVPDGTPGLHLLRLAGLVVFAVFGALLAFLVVAYRNRALAVRFTHRVLDPIFPRIAERASAMMDAFIHGLRLVPSRRKVAAFFLLTAGYWCLNAWGMSVLARAFDLHLSLVQAFTVLGVLVVGVMIPAGPGMVGTFQAATVLGRLPLRAEGGPRHPGHRLRQRALGGATGLHHRARPLLPLLPAHPDGPDLLRAGRGGGGARGGGEGVRGGGGRRAAAGRPGALTGQLGMDL